MYADETGLQFCIDCPAGQFLELSMSDSVEDCVDCDVGKYVGSTGSDHVSHCSKCPPGMYGDQTGLVVCEECGVGGYMPEEGALGRQATASKLAHSCNRISEFTSAPSQHACGAAMVLLVRGLHRHFALSVSAPIGVPHTHENGMRLNDMQNPRRQATEAGQNRV